MFGIKRYDLQAAFFSGLWGRPMRASVRFKDYIWTTPFDDEWWEPKREHAGFELIPSTRGQDDARRLLEQLMQRQLDFPTRDIEGMTETELMAQQLLGDYAKSGTPEGRAESMDVLRSIIGGPTDITELPEYKAILSSVEADTSDLVNQAMRRLQLSGMETSTPQNTAVGKELARGRQRAIADLAPIAAAERGRRLSSIDLLNNLIGADEASIMNKLGAVQMFGGLPRQIEQKRKDAEMQQLMAQLFGDYQYKVPLADRLLSEMRYMYDPGVIVQSQHQSAMEISDTLANWYSAGMGGSTSKSSNPQPQQPSPQYSGTGYSYGGGQQGYSEPYPNYNAGGGGGYSYSGGGTGQQYYGGTPYPMY